SKPNCVPATSASRPIRLTPCMVCMTLYCAAMPLSVVLSDSMPATVLICVICVVICALSIGFIGSWLLSCATSSLRNRSCVALALVASVADLAVELPAALLRPDRSMGLENIMVRGSSLAHLQRLEHQAPGGVHHL